MQLQILSESQKKLLPLLSLFKADFGLVGGTALALQIGHRKSIDFDLFSNKVFTNQRIKNKILHNHYEIEKTLIDEKGELTLIIEGVKVTFLFYPYTFSFDIKWEVIDIGDILTIGALKAYALGRRAKWKDYVDFYFILDKYFSIGEISQKAKEIFKKEYNEKLFRAQLTYFKDLDYSEKVNFMPNLEIKDEIIKQELIKDSLVN